MKKDFDFIVELIDEFTRQKSIRDRLNIIEDEDITGWEIWWQIEFASFLSNHSKINDWDREYIFPVDKRTKWKKEKMSVDFILKKKYSKKDEYIALELKQNKSMQQCIRNMMKDIEKINSVRNSYNFMRSFWNIGIHRLEEEEKEKKVINSVSSELINNCILTKPIKKTSFAYTVF